MKSSMSIYAKLVTPMDLAAYSLYILLKNSYSPNVSPSEILDNFIWGLLYYSIFKNISTEPLRIKYILFPYSPSL